MAEKNPIYTCYPPKFAYSWRESKGKSLTVNREVTLALIKRIAYIWLSNNTPHRIECPAPTTCSWCHYPELSLDRWHWPTRWKTLCSRSWVSSRRACRKQHPGMCLWLCMVYSLLATTKTPLEHIACVMASSIECEMINGPWTPTVFLT